MEYSLLVPFVFVKLAPESMADICDATGFESVEGLGDFMKTFREELGDLPNSRIAMIFARTSARETRATTLKRIASTLATYRKLKAKSAENSRMKTALIREKLKQIRAIEQANEEERIKHIAKQLDRLEPRKMSSFRNDAEAPQTQFATPRTLFALQQPQQPQPTQTPTQPPPPTQTPPQPTQPPPTQTPPQQPPQPTQPTPGALQPLRIIPSVENAPQSTAVAKSVLMNHRTQPMQPMPPALGASQVSAKLEAKKNKAEADRINAIKRHYVEISRDYQEHHEEREWRKICSVRCDNEIRALKFPAFEHRNAIGEIDIIKQKLHELSDFKMMPHIDKVEPVYVAMFEKYIKELEAGRIMPLPLDYYVHEAFKKELGEHFEQTE